MVAPAPVPDDPAQLREIAALELQRLERDTGRSAWERQDLLADLASRLGILVAGKQGPEYEPLRRLVEDLGAGGDVDQLWARAVRVLKEFAEVPQRRRSFWR
jgi:Ca-activated chloride channel family protein